jgi:hypothetical protein
MAYVSKIGKNKSTDAVKLLKYSIIPNSSCVVVEQYNGLRRAKLTKCSFPFTFNHEKVYLCALPI